MPIPVILAGAAIVAAGWGVKEGVEGAGKAMEANDTIKSAQSRHEKNIDKFKNQSKVTSENMDNLGMKELEILKSFEHFMDVFEKIQGRPQFKTYNKDGINIPEYNKEELKRVYIGAELLLGGIGGAAAGAAGGFAAAGVTTSAVMALGTASTGTAIASLSGAAATNATLAALGGGAIAAGGGGIALGTTVLGAATLGVGLLVGGIIFNIAGSSLSDKADKVWEEMKKAEEEINKVCSYLEELSNTALKFDEAISAVNKVYKEHLDRLMYIVYIDKKIYWDDFTYEEKLLTENTVLLVKLLYNMGKVKLVLTPKDLVLRSQNKILENKNELNKVNKEEVDKEIKNAKEVLNSIALKEKSLIEIDS